MQFILNNESEINKRVYQFPTSQIKLHNKKNSYYEVTSSLKFKEVNEVLKRIYNRINLKDINELIDDISIISDAHKEFLKRIILERYNKIIKYSYLKLKELKNEQIYF